MSRLHNSGESENRMTQSKIVARKATAKVEKDEPVDIALASVAIPIPVSIQLEVFHKLLRKYKREDNATAIFLVAEQITRLEKAKAEGIK